MSVASETAYKAYCLGGLKSQDWQLIEFGLSSQHFKISTDDDDGFQR
jgi:hypothetical protein